MGRWGMVYCPVFPARAGMIRRTLLRGGLCGCIPRESGDDPMGGGVGVALVLVFPARAGMIPISWTSSTAPQSIPRESGDDPAR